MARGSAEIAHTALKIFLQEMGAEYLPNEEIEMTEQEALERLAALSLFARFV